MQIRRLKIKAKSIKILNKKHSPLSKKQLQELENLLRQHLNGVQLQFVMSQLRASNRSVRARRWTTTDKAFALSMLHSSPKTYRLLRKIFALPSIQTLRKIMNNLDLYPGFNKNILEALRIKVQKLPPAARLVCIAMDEMSIKTGVSYDCRRDVVEGVIGQQLADHAIAFVVRGIIFRWKQPFGYFFSAGTMSGQQMQTLLFEGIQLLQDLGLTVTAVISDQGSNNINLFQTRLHVTPDKPYFLHEDNKIYVIYDPPHLIKNIRNNLKNHGFEVEKKDIMWHHICDFYDLDSSKATRFAPKLTEKHIKLPPFAALRVKLATQVLSHSVATGIKLMTEWGIMEEEANHTANFLEHFDQLFNACNSSTLSSPSVMKHAFQASSGHIEFLLSELRWLNLIKSKGSRMPLCIAGWKVTINSLLQLWNYLSTEHGIKFLFTRQLNQDMVENLFSIVRSKGAARDSPDASQFRAALRQVMVDSVMQKGKMSNCEEDVDEFLISLKNTPSQSQTFLVPAAPSVTSAASLPANVQPVTTLSATELDDLSLQEKNVMVYIGGYIVRKISAKICEPCRVLISSEISMSNPEHAFIKLKNHKEAKVGLQVPSSVLSTSLKQMECAYLKHIDDIIYSPGVKATLVPLLLAQIDAKLICDQCHLHYIITGLMVNIRFHHTLRQMNIKIRDTKGRKNRKTLKFSHL